jgi:hypothetical protein
MKECETQVQQNISINSLCARIRKETETDIVKGHLSYRVVLKRCLEASSTHRLDVVFQPVYSAKSPRQEDMLI